jgi:hypothetical protein
MFHELVIPAVQHDGTGDTENESNNFNGVLCQRLFMNLINALNGAD